MTTSILLGSALVLGTWVVAVFVLMATGLPLAQITARGLAIGTLTRVSLWWGVALLTLVVLAWAAVEPLGSVGLGVLIALIFIVAAVIGLVTLRHRPPAKSRRRRVTAAAGFVMVSLGLMVVYLAYKTLGPATNYDTGLYHVGFIRYLHDFGTVPGLANLFLPLGYANAQFPLAAALGSGPWGGDGWRLLNGLIVVIVVTDLVLRMLERRWTWGTYALLVGLGAASLPLVAMADSLVASPTSDTSVLLLTLVSAASLCDLLGRRRSSVTSPGVASDVTVLAITAGLLIAMRPTMLAYVGALALVVAFILWRRRSAIVVQPATWAVIGIWLLLLGTVQLYRDYLLSGWLLYPLSLLPWDVTWLARDPTPLREATLAAARDPSARDSNVVAHSWSWIDNWIVRLPTQWEPWFIGVGVLVAIGISLLARRASGFPRRPRALLLALTPGVVAIAAWFVLSPPSFRFTWGPIFALLAILIGAALHDMATRGVSVTWALIAIGLTITTVTLYSVTFRNLAAEYTDSGAFHVGPLSLRYATAPLPDVPTRELTMIGGLVLQEPLKGDQCWNVYPLCTFSMGDRVGLIGDSIDEGFVTLR